MIGVFTLFNAFSSVLPFVEDNANRRIYWFQLGEGPYIKVTLYQRGFFCGLFKLSAGYVALMESCIALAQSETSLRWPSSSLA
jgi:hypothetical protein